MKGLLPYTTAGAVLSLLSIALVYATIAWEFCQLNYIEVTDTKGFCPPPIH